MTVINMTPEQRAENLQKAHESQARQKQHADEHYRQIPKDDLDAWKRLAEEYGVRLPNQVQAPTPKLLRRVLRQLSLRERDFKEMTGLESLDNFIELNPTWSGLAVVGLLLEYKDDLETAQENLKVFNTESD